MATLSGETSPARCPWPRVRRALLPLSSVSQAAGPAPEFGVGPCVLRDKKRRSASAMAVHSLRFRVHLFRIVSVFGTILLLGAGLFQAAYGGLKKVEGTAPDVAKGADRSTFPV